MGTDCAPFLANLFLYSYEYEWIEKQRVLNNYSLLHSFKNCCRSIDDLLMTNNDGHMERVMTDIYPKELVLVPDNSDGLSTPFLDLQLVVKKGVISTSIFDKRDAFDFKIINFPTLTGNIPLKSSYCVFLNSFKSVVKHATPSTPDGHGRQFHIGVFLLYSLELSSFLLLLLPPPYHYQ